MKLKKNKLKPKKAIQYEIKIKLPDHNKIPELGHFETIPFTFRSKKTRADLVKICDKQGLSYVLSELK
jgi:hypothetical protein